MPISVKYINDSVRALWTKDKSGYFTNETINNWISASQSTLFEYYWDLKTRDSKNAVDALEPFYKKVSVIFTNGQASKPSDLNHEDVWIYNWAKNTPTGIQVQPIPIIYKSLSEISEIYRNPLAKPSLIKKRCYWNYVNNVFNVYPTTIGSADLYYYRIPNAAIYATTTVVTPNGTTQIFDPLTSVDLEWNVADQENFIDLITFYAGLPLRDSDVIQFVKAKQKEGLVN